MTSTIQIKFANAGETIIVPDDYPTIQKAINVATEGDIVLVKARVYDEDITIRKSLTLRGENRSTTIINGSVLVYPYTSNVEISGFTIRNAGEHTHGWGIYVHWQNVNVTIFDNVIEGCSCGIRLSYLATGNTIDSNHIINANNGIWVDSHSYKNMITHNKIDGRGREFSNGINVYGNCWNNTIIENTILNMNFMSAISLSNSSRNRVEGNTIANSECGIGIYSPIEGGEGGTWSSVDNILRNNKITNCKYGLSINGKLLREFIHDIDPSNKIDGRPVYYWINKKNQTVPSDAGYVALINSTNITVENLNLKNNSHAILLAFTENSLIRNNNVTNNKHGIWLLRSSNNTVSENNIANNSFSGIWLRNSSNNMFYHNNLIGNGLDSISIESVNVWDDGYPSGGNYWSDYRDRYPNATELDGSGIWDTPYVIDENNQDNYPLMNPYVEEGRPVAYLSASPTTVIANVEEVTFDASASYDPDGSVIAYWYDYGDGFDSGWVDESVHYRSYPDSGEYHAKAMVKDADGLLSDWSDEVKIIVNPITNLPPEAYIDSISLNPAEEGETIYFQGHGTDPDGEIIEYSWSSSIDGFLSNQSSFSSSDLSVGTHMIYFSVKDNDNAWSEPAEETLIINPKEIPEVKLNVTISSDRDLLKYERNEVEITVKIKNIGDYVARDVSIDILIPYNFETQGSTHWSGNVQAGEEKVISIDAKAKRCMSGTFTVQGTYKDAQDKTVDIPSKSLTILIEDFVLIEYAEAWTDVNLSPERVNKAKSWGGAENTASAIWLMTLILDLDLDEITIETLFEHTDSLISWLMDLWESGEVDPEILLVIGDWIAGLAINTIGLYITVNYRQDELYEDGTVDYHASWPMKAMKWLLKEIINMFLDAIEEGIEQRLMSNNFLFLEDKEGKLYLHVYDSQGDELKVYYAENMALAIIEPEVTEFHYVIDAEEAHEPTEEYTVVYLGIREGEIVEEELMTETIEKGKSQEFEVQLNPDGTMKSWKELPTPGPGIPLWIIACIVVLIVAVAAVAWKRKKPG